MYLLFQRVNRRVRKVRRCVELLVLTPKMTVQVYNACLFTAISILQGLIGHISVVGIFNLVFLMTFVLTSNY